MKESILISILQEIWILNLRNRTMLHVFIIDYQAKIACIWDLDAKVDTFLGKNGDTIYYNMKNRTYVQYLKYAKEK